MTKTSLGMGNFQYTLTPGRYTNLPNFNTGDVVILEQASTNGAGGIFYIDGGGLHSTGATITMGTGSGGVMIYNRPAGSDNSDKIQITGNKDGTVNFSGLASGPYAGLVLWQDRTSKVELLDRRRRQLLDPGNALCRRRSPQRQRQRQELQRRHYRLLRG